MHTQLFLSSEALAEVTRRLDEANARIRQLYPGESGERQPVHSVYGGAHLFKAGGDRRLGDLALASMDEYAPDFVAFARALGLPGADTLPAASAESAEVAALEMGANPAARLAHAVHARVRDKLRREPVESQHADFEDGYGYRPDDEEDRDAAAVAEQLAQGMEQRTLPPQIGIRIKSFAPESYPRALRTLDLVVSGLAARTGGAVPPGFLVTLPKITAPEQVAVLADVLGLLEARNRIAPGAIRISLMIETPQALVNHLGECSIRRLVEAGRGRVMSCSLGPYDYTASLGISARDQALDHPSADFARQAMLLALSGSGVTISDGPTTSMPIGPHRATADKPQTEAQREENRAVVHQAWKLHYDNIQRALRSGYYQGWDLHPAQLPARYGAVYAFFLGRLDDAARRLKAFVERAAQATLVGNTFDDAATGQGLLNFFLRGIACGALAESEAVAAGITIEELRGRSFARIVANRAANSTD
jgi:citrate lyase beta subunit